MDLKIPLIIVLLNILVDIAEASLTIVATPPEVQLGRSALIRCDGSTSHFAYRIEIRRSSFGLYSGSLLAEIDVGSGSLPIAKDRNLIQRGATVEGYLDVQNAKDTFLQLKIPETACVDNSQYICNVIGSMNGNGELPRPLETSKVLLSVTTLPDGLMMKVSPALNTKLGDRVLFWCRGHIGKPARDIVWERQRLKDEFPEKVSVGVENGDIVLDYGICHFSGESVLNYDVTKEDQGAIFTCKTDRDIDEVHYSYRLHIAVSSSRAVLEECQKGISKTMWTQNSFRSYSEYTPLDVGCLTGELATRVAQRMDLPLSDSSSGSRWTFLTDSYIVHLTLFAYILYSHLFFRS